MSLPLALIGPPGVPELIIVLVIIMFFFGAGKLPEVAKSLGKSMKTFKDAQKPDALDVTPASDDLGVAETSAKAPAEVGEKVL